MQKTNYLNKSGLATFVCCMLLGANVFASSHREAPLISRDPQADDTDLYAVRSPDDPNTITIIANYIPFELPEGGPNYYTFGRNVRYEIHIKNKTTTTGDDITYRFTFSLANQDTTTFFNIRLTSTGGVFCKFPKSLSAKVGYRYMTDRPANESGSLVAKGYTVFDAAVIYNRSRFQYSAQVQNLFNVVWREAQFATETRLRNEVMSGQPGQTDICFTPGSPFLLKLTATCKF